MVHVIACSIYDESIRKLETTVDFFEGHVYLEHIHMLAYRVIMGRLLRLIDPDLDFWSHLTADG